jgi:hypothetical protein
VIAAYHPIPAIVAITVVAGIVLGVAAKTTRTKPVALVATVAVVAPVAPVTPGSFGARWPSIDLTVEAAEPFRSPDVSEGIPKSAEVSRTPSGSEAGTPEPAPHRATNICEAVGRHKVWLSRHRWRCRRG